MGAAPFPSRVIVSYAPGKEDGLRHDEVGQMTEALIIMRERGRRAKEAERARSFEQEQREQRAGQIDSRCRTFDGQVGTSLASAGCDGSAPTLAADQQPQPLAVDSRDPGAAQGKSAPETFMGNPVPGITRTVKATSAPLADAGVTIGQLGQPAAFTINGATSSARTEVIMGNILSAGLGQAPARAVRNLLKGRFAGGGNDIARE